MPWNVLRHFILILCVLTCPLTVNTVSAAVLPLSQHDLTHGIAAVKAANREAWKEAYSHARASHDPSVRSLVQWMHYRQTNTDASFKDITQFVKQHSHWPELDKIKRRAEEAITDDISVDAVYQWFSHYPPLTAKGMELWSQILESKGVVNKGKNVEKNQLAITPKEWIKRAWIEGNFTEAQEQNFLKKYASYLTQKDHEQRVDRLLWNEKTQAAKRILSSLGAHKKNIALQRIAIQQGKKQSTRISLQDYAQEEGLLYDVAKYHSAHGEEAALLKVLLHVSKHHGKSSNYPEKWWPLKNKFVREMLKEKHYHNAYLLAKTHGLEEGVQFAEGEWLAGWISLRFLQQPKTSYSHFYNLYNHVKFAVSKSRAAYWAARAAEAGAHPDIAKNWYKVAAKHPDTFYGQLALAKLHTTANLALPATPKPSPVDHKNFTRSSLAKACHILLKSQHPVLTKLFLSSAITATQSPGEMLLITELAKHYAGQGLGVEIAKHAAHKGVILTNVSYPKLKNTPPDYAEQALVMGIIRQESNFDTRAKSPAGALGMMQLLPSTAKEMAQSLHLRHDQRKLTQDPHYNVQVGTYYISRLLQQFNGSYILALSSYNAGIGNVGKWLKIYGDPRKLTSLDKVIDWIETIPFAQTRDYVERVLENTQVYRTLVPQQKEDNNLRITSDIYRAAEG